MDKVVEDITSVVDPKVSLLKSTMKTTTKKGRTKKSDINNITGAGARKSTRASRSSTNMVDMATPATSNRSKSNSKTPAGPGMLPPDMATPATSNRSKSNSKTP